MSKKTSSIPMILFLAIVIPAGVYGVAAIRQLFLVSSLGNALFSDVSNTQSYTRVNAEDVKEKAKVVLSRHKVHDTKVYVTLEPRSEFKGKDSYYLKPSLRGYENIRKAQAKAWIGCNTRDALPPNFSLRNLTGKGRASLQNRVQGIISGDGQAVLTGRKKKTPTGNVIVFSLDTFITFKTLFVKRKLWFHHRCYFYEKRRAYSSHDDSKKLLSGE